MSKITLWNTAAEIEAAIDSFKRRGATLQKDAHKIACSVLQHVAEHHDVRMVTRFLEAMPEAIRSNAVRKWFETFGPVGFDKKGPLYVADRKTRLADAINTPFWRFAASEGTEYKPLDVEKFLQDAVKRLRKDEKETGRNHSATIMALMCAPATTPSADNEDQPAEQAAAA